MKLNCCQGCYTNYTNDEHQLEDACKKPSCECHRNTSWHPNGVECENNCSFEKPYGFVPEAGCKVHD